MNSEQNIIKLKYLDTTRTFLNTWNIETK